MATTLVVRQGDSITALAEQHGLFAETIWTHPANEELAKKRSNMNELLPGDEVCIPEPRVKRHKVAAGKAHRFRRKGVPAKLVLKIAYLGMLRAKQDYVLTVGKQQLAGTTDADGMLEQFVPAQAKEGTLVIGPDEFELVIRFGHQDPHDELTGIQRRLANLGYLHDTPSGKLDDETRRALLAFETSHQLEAKGEPTTVNGGVMVDIHRGARDFGPRAESSGEWPSEPKGQTATMSASFAVSGGSGRESPKGGGKGSGDLNVFNVAPPFGYYVILGRGVTAWYNHLTLLGDAWGQGRLTLHMPVMHLGYDEPWARRRQERMGQWPRMLDFFQGLDPQGLGPGLALQGVPAQQMQNDWLPSATFAANLQRAETTVLNHYLVSKRANGGWQVNPNAVRLASVELRDGFATVIESHHNWQGQAGLPQQERDRWNASAHTWGEQSIWHNLDCPYRISVYHQGVHSYVYAYKVDVCTGPGQQRLFDQAFFGGDNALYQEHLPAYDQIPARYDQGAGMPRIINGNDYIGAHNDPNETIVVFKGNPVGAQSVQSALDMPDPANGHPVRRVWWVVNKSLHHELGSQVIPRMGNDADVPGKRNLLEQIGNDALIFNEAQDITDNHLNWLLWNTQAFRDLQFQDRLMRVGFHEIAGFRAMPDGTILVRFNLHPYGDVGRPVPQFIPRLAEASLRVMQQAHPAGPYPPELATRHDLEPLTGHAREHIDTLTVDRVVYSLGQDRGVQSEGTAAYLVQLLGGMQAVNLEGFPAYVTDGQLDPDAGNGVTGRVRVLGAAIVDGPGVAAGPGAINQGHNQHGGTVPQEAPAGGGGMNMAVTNIRRANAYTPGPVRLNFASVNELQNAGLALVTAQRIVALRSMTTRGFTVQQFSALLGLTVFLTGGPMAFAVDALLLTNNPAQFAF